MKNEAGPEVPTDAATVERLRKRHFRRAVAFGVIMASAQMGILLYFMYC
jgi:hypothetical protein